MLVINEAIGYFRRAVFGIKLKLPIFSFERVRPR
jgi:hypothetical protein